MPEIANKSDEQFRKLAEQYPGLEPLIDRGIAWPSTGRSTATPGRRKLPKGAEIFLLPRLAGG
jgi:sulfur-carrier protein